MIDPDHPVYKPLWRRLLIVGFCAAWAGFELYSGEIFWAIIVGALGAYAAYKLLFTFKGGRPAADGEGSQEERR